MKQLLNINYLYQAPKQFNPKSPIILLLHGYGSNEEDLFSFSNDLEQFHVLSLRAVRTTPMGGYSWYDLNYDGRNIESDQEQAKESLKKLSNFIDAILTEIETESKKVWLAGFSQGAILSYALGLNHPEKVKRAICLSGFPDGRLIEKRKNLNDYSNLRFFASHGENDMVIPVSWARNVEPLLTELKIKHEYHEYHSGHGLIPQNYMDLMNWIQAESKELGIL